MKKRILIGGGIAIAFLALAYFISIPIWNAQFDGIDGYYQSGWCMCVEEIFAEYRDGEWYITSHHDRRLHGTVVADGDHWNVLKGGTQLVWIVEMKNEQPFFTYAKTQKGAVGERVNNPWRLWLPSIFGKDPEHNN